VEAKGFAKHGISDRGPRIRIFPSTDDPMYRKEEPNLTNATGFYPYWFIDIASKSPKRTGRRYRRVYSDSENNTCSYDDRNIYISNLAIRVGI